MPFDTTWQQPVDVQDSCDTQYSQYQFPTLLTPLHEHLWPVSGISETCTDPHMSASLPTCAAAMNTMNNSSYSGSNQLDQAAQDGLPSILDGSTTLHHSQPPGISILDSSEKDSSEKDSIPSAAPSSACSQNVSCYGTHRSYQTGQPPYHMTLETSWGPMAVPVALDLQHASEVADKKRKRNAGASARLRARRKQQEKAASQIIKGLQQKLQAMRGERDCYLAEYNSLREYVGRQHHWSATKSPLSTCPEKGL